MGTPASMKPPTAQFDPGDGLPVPPAKGFLPGMTGEHLVLGLAFAIFFCSGFAALLYQVIWQRMLGMFSGVDIYSVTIIVAAYMAGLGCGSLVGGHLADYLPRRANLLLFAGSQLCIALFALVSKTLYYDTLYMQYHELAGSPITLAVTLFVSLLWPTFFMGISLPLLARALTWDITTAAGTVGILYGVNTLGAAAGSLLTTWIAMRRYGFEANLYLGAMINLAAAVCIALLAVYLWKRPLRPAGNGESGAHSPGELPTAHGPERGTGLSLKVWLLIYGLSGFIAMSLELVWFRILGIMLKSTAFTFGTMLAVYLAGLAFGAMVGVPMVRRSRRPAQTFFLLQTSIGLYACVSLILLMAALGNHPSLTQLWQYLGGYEPMDIGWDANTLWNQLSLSDHGAVDPSTRGLATRLAALYIALPTYLVGPPTVIMGMSFPYLQKVIQQDASYLGRRVGWLQTTNIVGCTLGAVLTGWGFLAWLGTAGTMQLMLALTGVFLLLWARGRWVSPARWLPAAGAMTTALLVIGGLTPNGSTLWAKMHGTHRERILFVEDGSGLSLLKNAEADSGGKGSRWVVFANGRGESWIPYGDIHTTLGALPALLHPKPERIAVIGLGSGDTLFHLAMRPETVELTAIEIVGSQLSSLRRLEAQCAYPALKSVLHDPRIHHVVADGRIHIMQRGQKYDIIEADALRPNSAYSGNLYSREYFELLRSHLAQGGMAVTWSPSSRTWNTFLRVFPHVLSFGGVILVGSNDPIPFDLEAINQRLEHPFTQSHNARSLVDVGKTVNAFISANRPVYFDPAHDRSPLTDVNSDLFPKDEYMVFHR